MWQFPTHLIGGSPFNMRVLLDLQCHHMIGILLPDCLTCMIQAFRGRFPGGLASKRIWRSPRQLHSKHGGSLTSNDPDLWSTSSSACTLDSPPSCNTEQTTSASGSSHIPIQHPSSEPVRHITHPLDQTASSLPTEQRPTAQYCPF